MSGTKIQLNDVDLETIGQLIAEYKDDPDAGRSQWSARVQWLGGFRSEAQVRDLPPVRSDEPSWLGGSGTGPNPVELLLGALGQCLAIGYVANASAQGVRIDALEISLDGEIDLPVFFGLTGGNAGYDRVRVKVHVDADATREQLELIHKQVVATSPVGNTLTQPVGLEVELA